MWGNSLRDNVVTVFVSVVCRICVVVETEGKWVKPERSTTLGIWVHWMNDWLNRYYVVYRCLSWGVTSEGELQVYKMQAKYIHLNKWVTQEASVEMKGHLYCVMVIRHNSPGWLRRTVVLCTVHDYCFLPVCRLYMTSCLPSIAWFVSVPLFMVDFLVDSVIIWYDLINVVISLP